MPENPTSERRIAAGEPAVETPTRPAGRTGSLTIRLVLMVLVCAMATVLAGPSFHFSAIVLWYPVYFVLFLPIFSCQLLFL